VEMQQRPIESVGMVEVHPLPRLQRNLFHAAIV
jgi:hypothetical protein